MRIYRLHKEFTKEETFMNNLASIVNGSLEIEARRQRMIMPPDEILGAYEANMSILTDLFTRAPKQKRYIDRLTRI